MIKKKLFVIIAVVLLLCNLCSCGQDNGGISFYIYDTEGNVYLVSVADNKLSVEKSESSPIHLQPLSILPVLHYEDYKLSQDEEKNVYLTADDADITVPLFRDDIKYTPVSFYVLNNKLVVLAISALPWSSEQMCTAVFQFNIGGNNITLQDYEEYDDEFESIGGIQLWFNLTEYEVRATDCEHFLVMQGSTIYDIDAVNKSIKKVCDEQSINVMMPLIDTHREWYKFFSDCSYDGKNYILSFPAYNEEEGEYFVVLSSDLELQYYLRYSSESIILLDKSGKKINSVGGSWSVHFPSYALRSDKWVSDLQAK